MSVFEHRRGWRGVIVVTICVAACDAPAPPLAALSPARQAAVEHVKINPDPAGRLTNLGTVHGYACNTAVLDIDAARRRATDQAKYQTYLMGGATISGFSCAVVQTTDKCPNCWLCAQCNGTAAAP